MDPIIIIAIVVVSVCLITFLFFFFKNKKKENVYNERITKIIENLGGNENIVDVIPKMSRVEFILKNYELINKDELKSLGVQGISKTSQKITLIVGNELADDLEKAFKRS